VASTRFKSRYLHADLFHRPMFKGYLNLAMRAAIQQTSPPELKEVASSCLHRVRFCYRSQCMSVISSSGPECVMAPVRSIGTNAWLITFTAERVDVRARHGRPRWSLSTGPRRKVLLTRPFRALA
jgi:hypothetical protein